MSESISRRALAKAGAATTLAVATARAQKVLGANDRVRLGFIGVANRGGQLMTAFQKHSDMEIVALCDVRKSHCERANRRLDGKAATYGDFRKLLDRKDVDAVVIATPDHWHAIQTIDSCEAQKDVYVEKPVSISVLEGRKMVDAARRNKRVVTVGLHRRSSQLYAKAAKFVQADKLGKVTISRAYHRSNMYPKGMGKAPPSDPPADLDWDMWLGPRPMRPYQATIEPYKFRWWHLYSSQMANQGVHFIDAVRWLTGDVAPKSICAMGGKFAVDDDRTIPDTMQTTFQFASGRLLTVGIYETSSNPTLPRAGYYMELRGTQGTLYGSDSAYEVIPERGGQFQDRKPRMEPLKVRAAGNNWSLTAQHARNFLDCVKSRQEPNADIEIGHRSTTFSLLTNISLAVGQRLEWDAENEKCIDNDAANAMLHYEYRKPWKLG